MTTRSNLTAIIGPTASGKTALAIDLARRLGRRCEAINADSRQVYRHMDIGTAKPTCEERRALPHHLIDIIDPDESFSLASWLALAKAALADIWSRGALPVVVGGTGQYVWALVEGWRVPEVPPQEDLRRELGSRPAEDLLAELRRVDPESEAFVQPRNARRLVRALEVAHVTGKPFSYWRTKEPPWFDWLALGVRYPREALYERIDGRVDAMFAAGFVDEVRSLRQMGYGPGLPAMSSIGYGEVNRHLNGEITLEEAIHRTKTGTHRLARHQSAWFKASDERIHWLEPNTAPEEATVLTREFLGSES